MLVGVIQDVGWDFGLSMLWRCGSAIPPFAGDKIAVRLLLYMLTHLGEAEKEDKWAAVTSNI